MYTKAQLIDGGWYVRSLSPRRVWNAAKITGSYLLSKWLKKNLHRGLPIALSLEPTTSCNLRCPECPSGLRSFTRPTGMLQPDLNRKLIDELAPTLTYLTYYFQGEPYLNTDFLKMVSYASEKNIYTATSTNAHYLNDDNCVETIKSGLKRLIISIDGIDQESYGKYRIGGQLEKVLAGTKRLMTWKKEMNSSTPFVIWQFIVFRHNEDQIDAIRSLAREVGVDHLAIKTAQIYDFETGSDLMPLNPKYRRYDTAKQGFSIRNKLLSHCWRMWHNAVVTWDGKVVPCCFDKDASYRMGDFKKASFKQIWNAAEYQRFRNLILKSRKNIDICKNCSEGTHIWN